MMTRTCLALCTFLALGCTPSDDKNDNTETDATTDSDDLETTATADTGDADAISFVDDAADGLSVVAVEPARYLGVWYEIATSPSPQQAACTATQAEYSLLDNGDIKVVNQCNLGSLDGDLRTIYLSIFELQENAGWGPPTTRCALIHLGRWLCRQWPTLVRPLCRRSVANGRLLLLLRVRPCGLSCDRSAARLRLGLPVGTSAC